MRKCLVYFALLLVGCDGNGIGSLVNTDIGQTPPTADSDWMDAIDWTARLTVPLPLNDVTWDGQVFIAVGYGGAILTSVDGIDWVTREPVSEDVLAAVTVFGADIYAVGGSGILLSTDHGESWDIFGIDSGYESHGIAWGNGRFVSVGTSVLSDEGAIYTTD